MSRSSGELTIGSTRTWIAAQRRIVVVGDARCTGTVVSTVRRTVVVDVGTVRCRIVVVVAGFVVDTAGLDVVVVVGCRPSINVETSSATPSGTRFSRPGRQ